MLKKFFWIFLEKGSVSLIQFITLIIMGRLLGPNDYGVYAAMLIFISLSEMLVDSGFGGALVYKRNVEQEDINTLFYTNALFSVVLYFIIYFSAPVIEQFYNIDSFALYLRVLALTIIIYSFSIVQIAMINRNLDFKKSSVINLLSCVISSLVAIVLAYYGWGVWALVMQSIINAALLSLLFWCSTQIRLSLSYSISSFRYFFKFGFNIVLSNILNTIVSNLSSSIIPKISTVSAAGNYYQSVRLSNVPSGILSSVIDKGVFPILSRERTNHEIVIKARSLNKYFITFLIPIFPLLSICSEEVIGLVLGEKWMEAVPYFKVLIWIGISLLLQGLYRNLVKSSGATKYILLVEIFKSILTLSVLLVAMFYGVMSLVYGVVVSTYLGALIWAVLVSRKMGYTLINQMTDIIKPMISVIFMYILILPISNLICGYWKLFVILIGYLLYLIVSVIIKNDTVLHSLKLIRTYFISDAK